jgi:ribosomal-protein-alanine N-acetyltransferase
MLNIQFDAFPIIETARLRLREIVPADADVLYRLRRDPAVTTYLDRDNDRDITVVHELIAKIGKSLEQGDGITWALSLRDSPELIGTLGFWRIDKAHHRAEIGYTLFPQFWRQGLMTEAIEAIMVYGFHHLKLHSVEANTAVGNTASQTLLERSGFVREAHFRENWYYNGKFTDSYIYCRLTPLR